MQNGLPNLSGERDAGALGPWALTCGARARTVAAVWVGLCCRNWHLESAALLEAGRELTDPWAEQRLTDVQAPVAYL
ncbi:hypothetical protein NDU88_004643 [Pleurodeles waltl]|uniref:Uncharacterized protein n=1 Tax=Pleurodeles waltl TaxID=8319 RepID=A0AAV7WAC2_PLEWA|nr:hypothetical protein NDU88_004643 [Pleurodeles waltl]